MNWQQLQSAKMPDVLAWASDEPWCRAMAACQQDGEWHAEGDVWTHTRLVCDQLLQLPEWPALPQREQTILLCTALFHDSAKPRTSQTDPLTQRVSSPKHAVLGEQIARSVLRDVGCDLATREEIARLVRYHGRPAFLLEKPQPAHEIVGLSWLVSHRLLYLFALADKRGRRTESSSRPEENLHYWKLLAQEHGCFDRPYPFASDQARFQFYRQPKPDLFYEPHEAYRCTVTVVCGLPGSGKDTWLATERPDLPVVSLDAIRAQLKVLPTDNQGQVAQRAQEQCREYLRSGISFAFNATNVLRQTRHRWIELCANYDARIELVYIEPPLAQILQQNKQRERQVPESVIHELAEKLEPPTWTEGHALTLLES